MFSEDMTIEKNLILIHKFRKWFLGGYMKSKSSLQQKAFLIQNSWRILRKRDNWFC